jgi:hypothetical protein
MYSESKAEKSTGILYIALSETERWQAAKAHFHQAVFPSVIYALAM